MRYLAQLSVSVLLAANLALLATIDVKASNTEKELEVGITEHLDRIVPDDIILTDQFGRQVNLKELINKPTALCFVYFRCPGICSPLMGGLADVIDKTDLKLGTDYQAITISIDPRESSELAFEKRVNYLKKIHSGVDTAAWIFLTGDSANILKATETFGFRYKLVNNEFMHEGALIMVSPKGKITRYLKGINFLPFEFKLALLEASQGKSSSAVSKVIQFCFTYDPAAQHYTLSITRISATIIIFFAVVLLVYLFIKSRKKKSNLLQ